MLRLLLNAMEHLPGGRGTRYSLDALQGDSLEDLWDSNPSVRSPHVAMCQRLGQ